MANSINYQNSHYPMYPNIAINITMPNAAPAAHPHCHCPHCVPEPNLAQQCCYELPQQQVLYPNPILNNNVIRESNYVSLPPAYYAETAAVVDKKAEEPIEKDTPVNIYPQNIYPKDIYPQDIYPQENYPYPKEYYVNNYNINNINEPQKNDTKPVSEKITDDEVEVVKLSDIQPIPAQEKIEPEKPNDTEKQAEAQNSAENKIIKESDLSTSKEIIENLDTKAQEQKEIEKNAVQTKVVALTNEYIMSLENYLNNPNTEIRLMAAKEILTRLDEDRNRYNDAALNALLNKMLQDPSKLIRIAAMSAFSSELASGNEYTVELLTKIQQNPESDPEDVLEASQILLNRTAITEVRYISQQEDKQAENE